MTVEQIVCCEDKPVKLEGIISKLKETRNCKAISNEIGLNYTLIQFIRNILDSQSMIEAAEANPELNLDYVNVHRSLDRISKVEFLDPDYRKHDVDHPNASVSIYDEILDFVFNLKTRVYVIRLRKDGLEKFVKDYFMNLRSPNLRSYYVQALLQFREEVCLYVLKLEKVTIKKPSTIVILNAILDLKKKS